MVRKDRGQEDRKQRVGRRKEVREVDVHAKLPVITETTTQAIVSKK
jgi:hypothetical protein